MGSDSEAAFASASGDLCPTRRDCFADASRPAAEPPASAEPTRSVVSAHGMRGLHSTLAVDADVTAHAVASALGHESFATTAQSYAKPEAVTAARQKRVLTVLAEGKR
jgi:integrase